MEADRKKKDMLRNLEKGGMLAGDVSRLRDTHLGVGKSHPIESPFKKHAQRPMLINLPYATFRARFLGPVFPVYVHWQDDGRSFPCFGDQCRVCPSYRSLYGYAPILANRMQPDGKVMLLNSVLCLWQSLVCVLEDLGVERGHLVEFERTSKNKEPKVEILEENEGVICPPWFDVRETLMGRWSLTYWPDQGFNTKQDELKRRETA